MCLLCVQLTYVNSEVYAQVVYITGEHSKEHFHLINGVRATNRFDDYSTGCQNSHCQQQFYSGLRSTYPDNYAQLTYEMTAGPAHSPFTVKHFSFRGSGIGKGND